jgi:hypothetical protein
MISESDKEASDLPSLPELLAIAAGAKDNETKAQALCLAAGVAHRMNLKAQARKLMARALIVVSCGGVTPPVRLRIAECAMGLEAARKPAKPKRAPQ